VAWTEIGPTQQAVLDLLRQDGGQRSVAWLAGASGKSKCAVNHALSRLTDGEMVVRTWRCRHHVYEAVR
jgi:DNA-binding transcriptional ArsR family regulator